MIAKLHLVTDDRVLGRAKFTEAASAALAAGGQRVAIHLRGPRTPARLLWEIGAALRPVAKAEGAAFLVNDRLDLALALDADGGHLAGQSVTVANARSLLGPTALVGCSVHGREDAGRASGNGVASGRGAPDASGAAGSRPADFVIAGALFPTPTHPARDASGVGLIAEVRDALPGLPVVGIGGVDASRVSEVVAAGAHGVAVVRAAWDALDAGAAVAELLDALDRTRGGPTDGGRHGGAPLDIVVKGALIDVVVNGAPRKAPAGATVKDLIESLGLAPAMVVVERNLEILERSAYGTVALAPGDRLELVHFVGGG